MTSSKKDDAKATAPATARAGSRVDAGTKTQSGPLGRIDPKRPEQGTPTPRPHPALAGATVIAGLAVLIGTLFVFGSIAEDIRDKEVFALDTWATPFLHSISSPGLNLVMNGFTAMGSAPVLIPFFAIAFGLLVLKRRFGAAAFLSIASGGALLIDATMKVIFQRPRPKLDYAAVLPDYSFPSGHSMNGVVFYVSLALIAWSIFGRRVGLIALGAASLLALAIGTSRIYLGYHYLTDVVGGFLAGIAWLLIVEAAFRVRPMIWSWASARRAAERAARRAASRSAKARR